MKRSRLKRKTPLKAKTGLKRTGFKKKGGQLKRSKLKKSSQKAIKRKLNEAQRKFNLLRRLELADDKGICSCVTCQTRLPYDRMHCGHYYHTQGHPNTRFDKINTHAQCVKCNTVKDGNLAEYERFLVKKYGKGALGDLTRKAKSPSDGFDIFALDSLITDMDEQIEFHRKRIEE